MKKIAFFLIAAVIVPLFASTLTQGEPSVKVGTIYDDIELSLDAKLEASLENLATTYEKDKIFISEEFYPEFTFNFVSLEWSQKTPDKTSVEIFMRTKKDDWTDWTPLEADPESKGDDLHLSYSFIATNPSDIFQYKVVMHTDDTSITPYLKDITFQYLDTTAEPRKLELGKVSFNDGDVDIISRTSWGAEKDYRLYDEIPEDIEDDWGKSSAIESEIWEGLYDDELEIETTVVSDPDGKRLIWALEYPEDVEKIVIHHTATDSDLEDPEAAIRAIYYYHAVTRGWGDIGYNYIIDQYGNIYEGRYGGDGVVGGHAAGYNIGTIGIAVLGNYENDELTYEALVSLLALIKEKADLWGISVEDTSKMREKTTKNLIGHRDLDATLCPGENIYGMMSYLRSAVAGSLDIYSYDDNAEYAYETANDWEPMYLEPEDEAEITFELENIGTETWDSDTFLVANMDYEGEMVASLNRAIDDSIAPMNELSVAPGEIGTFTVTVSSTLLGGFASFDVTPIFNGYKKTSNYMSLPVYVEAPDLSYEVFEIDVSDRLRSGDETTVEIVLENQGNVTWRNYGDYPLYLESEDGDLWDQVLMIEEDVEPGESASFEFTITGPEEAGYYVEFFVPVFEGVVSADATEDSYLEVLIYNDSQQAEFVSKSDKVEFYPGEEAEVWIEFLNTGYLDWTTENFSVGFVKYVGIGVDDEYLVETEVEPGETGKVKFTIEAPSELGDFKVNLKPRVDGRNLSPSYFYYEFSVVEGEEASYAMPDVRVALSFEGDPVITADGNFSMYRDDALIRNFTEDDQVEVAFNGVNYQVRAGGFAWVLDSFPTFKPANNSVIMEIVNFENRPAWNTDLNDNRFRGSLEVREDVVINELPLESYVKGIAEVSNGDPTEKLKTMAILARTYALFYIEIDEKFPGAPYDLNDDPEVCQKYLGYGYEDRSPNMASAVEETEGMVVTYEGELVKTPYFNSTDGTYTKSAEEVWGWTNTPYLVSVEDPLCESDAFSGHGVGLSGCGAEAAASAGNTYDEIIKYYYTGVEINHIDEL